MDKMFSSCNNTKLYTLTSSTDGNVNSKPEHHHKALGILRRLQATRKVIMATSLAVVATVTILVLLAINTGMQRVKDQFNQK